MTYQERFNALQAEAEKLTARRPWTFGFEHRDLLEAIAQLENELSEVAQELTAERHANNY